MGRRMILRGYRQAAPLQPLREKAADIIALLSFSHPRREKSPRGYSVLRKAVSRTELCSTSRRDRAALSTSVDENAAQATSGSVRLLRRGIFKGVCRP